MKICLIGFHFDMRANKVLNVQDFDLGQMLKVRFGPKPISKFEFKTSPTHPAQELFKIF